MIPEGHPGHGLMEGMTTQPHTRPPLVRSRLRMLGGVCAGLAGHLGQPVRAVRIGMVVAALLGGAGLVFYLWLWLLVPDADDARADEPGAVARGSIAARILQQPNAPVRTSGEAVDARRRFNPAVPVLIGVGLLLLAAALLTGSVPLQVLVPIAIAVVGLVLAWRQLATDEAEATNVTWQVVGGVALVIVGIVLFVLPGVDGRVLPVLGGTIAVLAGVGFAVAPWGIRLMRSLSSERAERARANERADIAAHLHDSVLQSLALIRQKSDPESEVARIARQQERELREWLFVRDTGLADSAEPQMSDIGVTLRKTAERLEDEYACTFDVVVVGDVAVPGVDALVAAASEAMLNAARHASGAIVVLIEATTTGAGGADAGAGSVPQHPDAERSSGARISVTVTDRGSGVDLARIPDDRQGIRSSILARMQRAGGEAAITAGPGGSGTRVVLTLPVGVTGDAGVTAHT